MTCRGVRGGNNRSSEHGVRDQRGNSGAAHGYRRGKRNRPEDVAGVIFHCDCRPGCCLPSRRGEGSWVGGKRHCCMQEMRVTGSLPRCIRVLLHWNTDRGTPGTSRTFISEKR